jgi:hypothetical protein
MTRPHLLTCVASTLKGHFVEPRSGYRTRAFLLSALVIAIGAAGFWVLVTIPREATVILIEQGPIAWITGGLWLVTFLLAVTHARGIRRFWRDGLVPGGMGMFLLLASGVMDRVQKSMKDRGPTGDRYVLGIGEELVEILVPIFFILALLQIGMRIRDAKAKSNSRVDDRIGP